MAFELVKMMRAMIQVCVDNALKFRFVLMGSWYASEENFDCIRSKGRHFIAALKDNRLIALSEEDKKQKCFVRRQSNHVFMAIYAAFKLQCLSIANKTNPFALCRNC